MNEKVYKRIVDGSLETRAKFNIMKEAIKLYHPEENIKTGEDALLYMIRRIPELEKEVLEIRVSKWELEKEKGLLIKTVTELKTKIKELEETIDNINYEITELREYNTGE